MATEAAALSLVQRFGLHMVEHDTKVAWGWQSETGTALVSWSELAANGKRLDASLYRTNGVGAAHCLLPLL